MSKKNLLLGGILIILIVVAYLYHGPLKEWRESLGQPKNFLANVNVDEIEEILVINNGQETILEKSGENFKVSGTKDFYVKDRIAKEIISSLAEATEAKLELVSNNKEKKNEFQTDENGFQIKIYQSGKQVADFIVGKMAPDYESIYISPNGADNTYIIEADLRSPFNQSEWRNDEIFFSDKEKINKIRFQYPTREFTIEKKDDKWQGTIPYGFAVSNEKIEEILNIMSNLTAAGIPEQDFSKSGLDQHLIIVQATGEGVDNTIMVGVADEDNSYYVKKASGDNIYLITEEERDELDKQIWELR